MTSRFRFLFLLGSAIFLTACGQLGAEFAKPGATVQVISATQYEITYEYKHDMGSELPYAGRQADAHCQTFGRRSALKQIVQKDMSRSQVTFRCE